MGVPEEHPLRVHVWQTAPDPRQGPLCHSEVYPGPSVSHNQGGGEEGILHDLHGTVITPLREASNPDASLTPL